MAEQVGISKSQVSRENIEASERLLKDLAARDFSDKEILIVYIDGIQFGDYHVLGAVGVDTEGHKHVLGLHEGATENAVVVKALLEELVARGVKPDRRRLFVIDGSKALRTAIDQVYGRQNPVQRCRNHKQRNVLGHLPKEQHEQASATLRAAWKLDEKQGKQKIEQYASWLEKDWPSSGGALGDFFSKGRGTKVLESNTDLLPFVFPGVELGPIRKGNLAGGDVNVGVREQFCSIGRGIRVHVRQLGERGGQVHREGRSDEVFDLLDGLRRTRGISSGRQTSRTSRNADRPEWQRLRRRDSTTSSGSRSRRTGRTARRNKVTSCVPC